MKNKRKLKNPVTKFSPNILYIQETLSPQLVKKDLGFIWSQKEVRAVFQPTKGHSGGMFISWDAEKI